MQKTVWPAENYIIKKFPDICIQNGIYQIVVRGGSHAGSEEKALDKTVRHWTNEKYTQTRPG
jgi:hypothetical protein